MNLPVLTLDDVDDQTLAFCGLTRGGATTASYRCEDKLSVLISTHSVTGPPHRKLNRAAVVEILKGFRKGDAIPPVKVSYEADASTFVLMDGMHRWRAALAFGYAELPCLLVDRD